MALSEILRHIYLNATDEVIRKGKKIYHTGGVHLADNDPLTESIEFRVRNDAFHNHYRVKINNYGPGGKKMSMRCQCPYNMGPVCKHEAAALFQLNNFIETGFFENIDIVYNQKNTTVRMRQITHHFLKLFSSAEAYKKGTALSKKRKNILIKEAKNDTVTAVITDEDNKVFPVILKQNEERYFDTSCTCTETKHPLCEHKIALFLRLYEKGGTHYFSTIRDWDAQKNRLLKLYGYSLEDDLKGKFEFAFHDGKMFMRVLNPSLKKITQTIDTQTDTEYTKPDASQTLGIVIKKGAKHFPFTDLWLVGGNIDKEGNRFKGRIKKLNYDKYIASADLSQDEKHLINSIRRTASIDELIKHIKRNSPFGDYLTNLTDKLTNETPEQEIIDQSWEYLLPKYQNLLKDFKDYPYCYFLKEEDSLTAKNLSEIKFSEDRFKLKIKVRNKKKAKTTDVSLEFWINEDFIPYQNVEIINNALIQVEGTYYAAGSLPIIHFLEFFKEKSALKLEQQDWNQFLDQHLLPQIGDIYLDLDEHLKENLQEVEPKLALEIKEANDLLVLKPLFIYDESERGWLDNRPIIFSKEGKLYVQERDIAAEQTFLNVLRYIHPDIRESRKSGSFLLPSDEIFKGNWYFDFLEKMETVGATISKDVQLKKFKINSNKPQTNLRITTGIDWFDAELDLKFGEEEVSIADLKKAFSRKENFVPLKDGSVGLLPGEWMEKYGMVVKLGKTNGEKGLIINKIHFSILDNIEENIDDLDLRKQLSERRERILSYDYNHPDAIQVPENVKAELRPYQKAGLQWIHFLNQTGWGGILADDMGLGKTIQTLAYLQYYTNQNPNARSLVVCPTTLIYNWESEIQKFTPDLSYKIHHGTGRTRNIEDLLADTNIIITTYGTLRSDITMLSKNQFDYVVMDESQAIKNPASLVSRASLLLQSKNRLALSGTPIQNNTFDIYSQMNFLNPGLLGTMEFFKDEFAVPIDKMQDQDGRNNLKRLIYPFLLRRTKEQVAPELPVKTETILYCEMGGKQKRIYNAYRNSFRTKILEEIDEKGIGNTRFSVLSGLMKLRQICDSPAILKDESYENHSIKIQELVRELSENTTNHKALIFSQFLGMLSLIKEELEKLEIPFVYFDGSTATKDREKAIQKFQNDDSYRVFLISLKAGGVGLNLTAADYVYIVDPWWNPTVEQQAIDRTHRIGQTKNIFAYRLICKDTIEEKILLLQERKRNLAKDLIADEGAFVKKLTRDDIAYLLS